MIREVKPMWKI